MSLRSVPPDILLQHGGNTGISKLSRIYTTAYTQPLRSDYTCEWGSFWYMDCVDYSILVRMRIILVYGLRGLQYISANEDHPGIRTVWTTVYWWEWGSSWYMDCVDYSILLRTLCSQTHFVITSHNTIKTSSQSQTWNDYIGILMHVVGPNWRGCVFLITHYL